MSEGEDNGSDPESNPVVSNEIVRLVAIIEICAVNAERSFLESQAAKQLDAMRKTVDKLANNHLELRSRAPMRWRERLMLVAFASGLAATVAAIVVRFAR